LFVKLYQWCPSL